MFCTCLFISLLCLHVRCCLPQASSDDEGLKEEEDDSSSKEEKNDEEGKDKTEEVFKLISFCCIFACWLIKVFMVWNSEFDWYLPKNDAETTIFFLLDQSQET